MLRLVVDPKKSLSLVLSDRRYIPPSKAEIHAEGEGHYQMVRPFTNDPSRITKATSSDCSGCSKRFTAAKIIGLIFQAGCLPRTCFSVER